MFTHMKGRKLYRNPKDALIFGIASGLASYLQVDSVFVRLALIAAAVLIGWSPLLVIYLVALVLLPVNPAQDSVDAVQEPKDVTDSVPREKMDRSQNM